MADTYEQMSDGCQVPFSPSARPRINSWMREQILVAVDLALAEPDSAPVRLGDKIRFERLIYGQLVRVQVRVDLDPPQIWNAYPVAGDS